MIPGNAVAVSPGKPFRGLQMFGNAFLQKFQCAEMNSDILESMTLIDTPVCAFESPLRVLSNDCMLYSSYRL